MNLEYFSYTRVVTKNIVTDGFQFVRNLFGLRMRGYEKMIQQAMDELIKEAELYHQIKSYRYIVNPFGSGSAIVILYGEGEKI